MAKGKIIDFFAHRKVKERLLSQKSEEINSSDMEGGVYYGHIHESYATEVRELGESLSTFSAHIEELMAQWVALENEYYQGVEEVLGILEMPGFDPNTHELQISEDGHCWLVEMAVPLQ